MDNVELIRKADLAISDLNSDGGALNTEQAERFVRTLNKVPTILTNVRRVPMLASTRKINKLRFNKRIMRVATSATALTGAAAQSSVAFDPLADAATRFKPETSNITLSTTEYICEIDLPYDVLEDNIERGSFGQRTDNGGTNAGGGLVDTILVLMAERAALDMEELAISGDTAVVAADPYLGSQNGYLKYVQANGNVVDHGGATIDKSRFKLQMRAMPDQYLRNKGSMRHYASQDQETEYRDFLADRATAVGDQAVQSSLLATPFGVPLEPVSLMPDAKMLFTNPKNLIWGIQRQITVEADRDISARVLNFVLTTRIAMQVEETEAAVLGINLGLS